MNSRSGTGIALLLACATTLNAAGPTPLTNAHSHNDYEHARPLLDALDRGFCSVEADIYLVNGELLVAHDRGKVRPERTLQALYLEPLRQRVKQNGGRVYRDGPEVTLLIDLKGDWKVVYPVLRKALEPYRDMLSTFCGDAKTPGAVMVIITGNRSRQMFSGEITRYACLDGDLPDIDSSDSVNLIPWISTNWGRAFLWRGRSPISEAELIKLKEMVSKVHKHGRRARFWGAPDTELFWKTLRDNGVDLINTDNLDGVRAFLLPH